MMEVSKCPARSRRGASYDLTKNGLSFEFDRRVCHIPEHAVLLFQTRRAMILLKK